MSKDYMTEGHAAWITYADPAGTVPSEKTNPWETPIGAADQFAPIDAVGQSGKGGGIQRPGAESGTRGCYRSRHL